MGHVRHWTAVGFTLIAALAAGAAQASVPNASVLEGTLNTTGGGPAADGNYAITFSIFKDANDPNPLWLEGPVQVPVKNGQFSYVLGGTTPLKPSVLGAGAFLSFKIGSDPELARKPVNASLFSLRAGIAEGVDCSACIPASALEANVMAAFAKKSDLSGVALSGNYSDLAGLPNLSGFAKTADLNKVATTGSWLDLKDKPVAAVVGKSCGTGLVVAGIKADGSLDCTQGGSAGSLPVDGIDEISNNLIFNQFTDAYPSPKQPIDIPDNSPLGMFDTIVVPDAGLAQKLSISLTLLNSDISKIQVTLFDPNNTEYLLYDKTGKKGDGIITTYPDNTKSVSGDLTTWVGKNPKGNWIIKVVDSSFLDNKVDGQVQKWSVNVVTLSSKKIQIKGDLYVDGKIISGGSNGSDALKTQDFKICTNADLNGPCVARFTGSRSFLEAAKYCASQKADICTDSQAYAARTQWTALVALSPNWTNSFAENDSSQWTNVNGGTGDNHSSESPFLTPCCYNYSPTVPGEQTYGGVRVLKVNNNADKTWAEAVAACLSVNADLCDKGQYYTIRQQGVINKNAWASDHSDNDSNYSNSSIGSVSDNPTPDQKYAYACCSTTRTALVCPNGSSEMGGVCVAKIVNSGQAFSTAANACSSLGARICSIAQTAVLRSLGAVTIGGSWTASHSDNDGQQAAIGVGNVDDDPPDGNGYGYACCF